MVKAVVLLSGGMDSATVLGIAHAGGYDVLALSFNYGQRHGRELDAGARVASYYGVDRFVMSLNFGGMLNSALVGAGNEEKTIPNYTGSPTHKGEIPPTYVPSRNIVFLSIACAIAESIGASIVFAGMNALDYSGYPDCRPEFVAAFNEMLKKGSKAGIAGKLEVRAPIIGLSKAQIVKLARSLGVPLQLTWSCYRGGGKACGTCDSCALRLKGFKEAGVTDPIEYEHLSSPAADALKTFVKVRE